MGPLYCPCKEVIITSSGTSIIAQMSMSLKIYFYGNTHVWTLNALDNKWHVLLDFMQWPESLYISEQTLCCCFSDHLF